MPGRETTWGRRRLLGTALAVPAAVALATGCDGPGGQGMGTDTTDLRSDVERAAPGTVDGAGAPTGRFAGRLLAQLDRAETNLVCSPLSAQIALAMVAAGAKGTTRAQMEDVLGADVEALGETFNALAQHLAGIGKKARERGEEDAPAQPRAALVNAVWGQEGLEVNQEFLDALARWYGTGVHTADFADDSGRAAACDRINAFVDKATNGLISRLVSPETLSAETVMLLVNALHLKTAWLKPLEQADAVEFTTTQGTAVSPQMLTAEVPGFYEDETCAASALRGVGGQVALALVRPSQDVGAVLDAWAEKPERVEAVLRGIEGSDASTTVTTPPFDIDWEKELRDPLSDLGMTDVFDPASADLTGISAREDLAVTAVLQKAVITVDKEGMEAAAATAVAVGVTAAVPRERKELVLDRPFLFIAYETDSCTPLVAGWIGDPTQTR